MNNINHYSLTKKQLATFFRNYGDVRPCVDTIKLLKTS